MKIKTNEINDASWREMVVKYNLPENLKILEEIAYNLWWYWDGDGKDLFQSIDNTAWEEAGSNPIQLFNKLSYKTLKELSENQDFLDKVDRVYEKYQNYINQEFDRNKPTIAYFSMEYGLTEILKIYSGGLGVLAGDYLKEASDSRVDMTAIGFLYRYGYFTQSLSPDHQQIAVYDAQNFNQLPLQQLKDENDMPITVEVPFPGRTVYAYMWEVKVGRIRLYLLDTDNDLNNECDRSITHQLYGGDCENRLKQEILLGIGGILALKKLGVEKQVYHCNEGHAALINLQRLVDLITEKNLSFNEALEIVRASSLYTVHTPVPAGHDSFEAELLCKYLSDYPEKLKISWDDFVGMGRVYPCDHNEKFNMSTFACKTCQEVNGVSWLHGKVSQEMFQPLWKGYFPEELHVSYVTNGVHLPTWAASEWKTLYEKYFTPEFYEDQSNMKMWEKIYDVPDREIWATRMELKNKLIDYIKIQFSDSWLKAQGDPKVLVSVLDSINPNALIIGFGRRFATYKRAHLLFTDLDRLDKIVNNPQRPVQFLYTGKAHPADGGGQALIKRIVEVSRMPQFLGKIIFLENYDMRLAKRLISGVDVWLNTPTRPLEASGTSGEKAQMNGVLNFSVLDGWWMEGYVRGAGWALTEKKTYDNQTYQDQLDAMTIYNMLEDEIIPLYFAKRSKEYPAEWVQVIKKSFAEITPRFTTKRMIDDYINKFYVKLSLRSEELKKNDYAKAKEIVAWKEKMAVYWNTIEVVSVKVPENFIHIPEVGENYDINIIVDTHDLDDKGVGVELVSTTVDQNNKTVLCDVQELSLVKSEDSKLYFNILYQLNMAGSFRYGFRMFPKNEDLPHRMDFCYVRWI